MALRWALAGRRGGRQRSSPTSGRPTAMWGRAPTPGLEFLHVNARTIINARPAAEPHALPLHHQRLSGVAAMPAVTASPARPTTTWGWASARTSRRKIVVKVNAVERLRAELRSPKWGGEHIAMGTNTDPYQHAEGKYHLTRGIVEVLSAARQPLQHPDQVDPHPARCGCCSSPRRRAHRRLGQLLRRHPGPLRLAADRAGHAPTRSAHRGSAAASTDAGICLRRPGGAGTARALRLPTTNCGRSSRPRRRRRSLRHRGGRCICGAACATTTSGGSTGCGPTWPRSTVNGSAGAPIRTRASGTASARWCGRRHVGSV